ncbi:MAG: hypothetical protein M3530_11800 [Thermoproteota archaeon]|nr:hypothetical protein [Thermoproteota archaeon]
MVSTKICSEDFTFLEKYARVCYNQNLISQPTISHLLRRIIKGWANGLREKEMNKKAQRVDELAHQLPQS